MEAAKSTVKKFMSSSGHHDTTVHEKVAPAVQNETVQKEQHERLTTAVDKEVHQDHYHTTEQPVKHSEVLPEQHHHNVIPTEHRSFEHDNADEVKRNLEAERSRYRDTQTHVEGQRTSTAEPTVAGEHVHHHVHETIQPVVQKQTIEPHVVHTTVPVHEVHHNAAKHHGASALPAVSMDDFKKQGGGLTGRDERHDKFDGCPPEQIAGGSHSHSSNSSSAMPTSGSHSTSSAMPTSGSHSTSSAMPTSGSHSTSDSTRGPTGTITDSTNSSGGPFNSHKHDNTSSSTSQSKPSMMDKMNPKVDADGDGKAGMMS